MLVVASAFLIPPTTDLQPERDMAESFRPCLYSQAVKLFLVALQFALGLLNSFVVLSLGVLGSCVTSGCILSWLSPIITSLKLKTFPPNLPETCLQQDGREENMRHDFFQFLTT